MLTETDTGRAADRPLAGSRPRILYLVHRVPYPPNRGDRIRSFHLLQFLAARADVSVAFLSRDPVARETLRVLGGLCEQVAAVRWGRWSRWVRAGCSFTAGRTATEGLFRSHELAETLRRWAEQKPFDLAFVFCSSMAQYLDAPALAGVPVVVDLVDVDSQKWFDYAGQCRGPMRWLFRLEGRRLRRLEASLPDRAEALTVVSPQEAALFRSFCRTDRVHVIQNGVDLEYFRPEGVARPAASQACVFVGALDYRANVDGASWFCREVWPDVRRRHPGADFRMVGSNPAAAARKLAALPGVTLVGEVPDVRPHLAGAAIAVVPLRVARGIQNKVLEAMAMGKAVIATPQALEGIGATPGVHVCQAASPQQWVDAVDELLAERELRDRLGGAARAFVESRFPWSARLQPLAGLPGLRRLFGAVDDRAAHPVARSQCPDPCKPVERPLHEPTSGANKR